MKAVRIHEDGGPEVLRYEDVARSRAPAPGEVLVAPARGVAQPPRRLGPQGAALGAEAAHPRRRRRRRRRGGRRGVDGFAVGDRVVINPGSSTATRSRVVGEHCDGTHAELIAIAARAGVPARRRPVVRGGRGVPARLRDGLPDARHEARLQEGEWVLIWGIGGGVATAAFEIAGARRADDRHVGQRREARAGECLGADVAVNHTSGDVVAR